MTFSLTNRHLRTQKKIFSIFYSNIFRVGKLTMPVSNRTSKIRKKVFVAACDAENAQPGTDDTELQSIPQSRIVSRHRWQPEILFTHSRGPVYLILAKSVFQHPEGC